MIRKICVAVAVFLLTCSAQDSMDVPHTSDLGAIINQEVARAKVHALAANDSMVSVSKLIATLRAIQREYEQTRTIATTNREEE